jgi:phage-related protein
MRVTNALVLTMLIVAASPVAAQNLPGRMNDACVNQVNGAYDAIASADWQARFARSDQNAIRQMAGVWYSETPSPQTGQIAYQWQSFQPNQIWDYRTRTCGYTGLCSEAYGTGMFASETQADGSLFVTTNFSDNNRRNACSGGYLRFIDQNTIMTSGGATLRRAQ